MFGLVFLGVVTTLTAFTIFRKAFAGKHKKAEKWERVEIMKQLLAQSEGERRSSAIVAPPAGFMPSESTSATSVDTSGKGRSRRRNSRRRNSMGTVQPPNSARPNRNDAQVEEKIRQRAYELYQKRGGANGNSTDDWLQAKQEILSRKATAGSASS